jgi:hypothetical protein
MIIKPALMKRMLRKEYLLARADKNAKRAARRRAAVAPLVSPLRSLAADQHKLERAARRAIRRAAEPRKVMNQNRGTLTVADLENPLFRRWEK